MAKTKVELRGFLGFIREQNVVDLAVGIILGLAVTSLVNSLIADIINPLLGLVLGYAEGLTSLVVQVGSAELTVGNFISTLIDFTVIALIVYFGVKLLKLDHKEK